MALGEVRKLESVQRCFTNKIFGINNLCYWSRLESLKLYSLERRRERYIILYIFKIIKGLVPNLTEESFRVRFENRGRRGIMCDIPCINRGAMARYMSLKDDSLCVRGPKLFNCLPAELRDVNFSFESFKRKLDDFLSKIPDKPSLPGPSYSQSARTNSIIDQLDSLRRQEIYH